MKLAIVIVALVACASAAPLLEEDQGRFLFTKWVKQHNKVYSGIEELLERFAIWKSNMEYIMNHELTREKLGKTWTLGMNKYGDLTNEEFRAKFNNYHRMTLRTNDKVANVSTVGLPSSVNWVTKGVVTPVKNQGQCGSCWAFSTTGSLESAHAIKTGQLISLSEQELVDCSGSAGNQGCNGGEMQAAFQWIQQNGGLCSESAYPYKAVDGTCEKSQCTSQVTDTGYENVTPNSEDALTAAAAQQPVSVAVDAGGSDWQLYSGGVLTDQGCGTQLDHGVLVAGYGSDNGQDYYLVKNSWGASWGENGYIRIGRSSGTGNPGICGIAMDGSYPTV